MKWRRTGGIVHIDYAAQFADEPRGGGGRQMWAIGSDGQVAKPASKARKVRNEVAYLLVDINVCRQLGIL